MRLPWVLAVLDCGLVTGCSDPAPANNGKAPAPSASTTDIDASYDVGDGRKLFLTCWARDHRRSCSRRAAAMTLAPGHAR